MVENSCFSIIVFPTLFHIFAFFLPLPPYSLGSFFFVPWNPKRREHKHKQTQPAVGGFLASRFLASSLATHPVECESRGWRVGIGIGDWGLGPWQRFSFGGVAPLTWHSHYDFNCWRTFLTSCPVRCYVTDCCWIGRRILGQTPASSCQQVSNYHYDCVYHPPTQTHHTWV